MKTRKPSGGGVFLGGPTILTVLLTLTLCCFALLTWFQARTDYGYAQRAAQTVSDFYAADGTVDTLLSETEPLRLSALPAVSGPAMAEEMDGDDSSAVYDPAAQTLTLTIPAGIQGDLQVIFELTEQEGGTGITLLSRRVIAHGVEEKEEHLNVLQEFGF